MWGARRLTRLALAIVVFIFSSKRNEMTECNLSLQTMIVAFSFKVTPYELMP